MAEQGGFAAKGECARRGSRLNHGFPPIAASGARVLILGTLPSVISLRTQQYYGNPQNAFWPIMGELFGAGPDTEYAERALRLAACGVAVWDVLESAERAGSCDADIVTASATPNDIETFLAEHRQVGTILFNGATAEALFRRMVVPVLSAGVALPDTVRLPSTSPLNARMDFAAKLAAWRIVVDRAGVR